MVIVGVDALLRYPIELEMSAMDGGMLILLSVRVENLGKIWAESLSILLVLVMVY